MRYYVIKENRLVERFLCDHHFCPHGNHQLRHGFPEAITHVPFGEDEQHFCSASCRDTYIKSRENALDFDCHH